MAAAAATAAATTGGWGDEGIKRSAAFGVGRDALPLTHSVRSKPFPLPLVCLCNPFPLARISCATLDKSLQASFGPLLSRSSIASANL